MLRLPTETDRPETVVLADGDYPSGRIAAALLRNARRVVCCDAAAARFIEEGGTPWAIAGDGDSLAIALAERYKPILFREKEQDTNDLTKAVRFCIAKGLRRIVILGATGRREDHSLGNISLLADYMKMGVEVRMVTNYGVFDPMEGEARFESRTGQQVSLFTPDPNTEVSGKGLKYPLPSRFSNWWCGTLNEATGTEFSLKISAQGIVYRLF